MKSKTKKGLQRSGHFELKSPGSRDQLELNRQPSFLGGGSTVPTDSLLNTRAEPVYIYYPGHFLFYLLPVLSNCLQPMDCSLSDSSVHGILQARILEWVAISFSMGSSRPREGTWVSCVFCTAGGFCTC